ncbi:MAG: long-chain fatty acid--CoA ligase, partial [Ignavibacteriaceae bacterium]|nr:long-chain fatty acid--CoA ligase [Ignavibacteriaceae bacterium]
MTLKSMLEESSIKYGEKAAVSFVDSDPISFSSYKKQVDQLVNFLKSRGIVHGDRIAILSENSP